MRKKLARKFFIVMLAMVLVIPIVASTTTTVSAMSNKKIASYMTKYLKYCKKGKYSKAKAVAKKMPRTAKKEKCVKNMSSKMKKAYGEIEEQVFYKGCGIYTDIDKNGVADMIISALGGTANIYTYKNGKAVFCGNVDIGYNWPGFYYYPKHNGVVVQWAKSAFTSDTLQVVKLKGTKASIKKIKWRNSTTPKIPAPGNMIGRG